MAEDESSGRHDTHYFFFFLGLILAALAAALPLEV